MQPPYIMMFIPLRTKQLSLSLSLSFSCMTRVTLKYNSARLAAALAARPGSANIVLNSDGGSDRDDRHVTTSDANVEKCST